MELQGAARQCIHDNNTCLHQAAICHGANTHVTRTLAVTPASALGGCISISGPGGTGRLRPACSPIYGAVWSVSALELLPSVWANTLVVCSSGLSLQQLWWWWWRHWFFLHATTSDSGRFFTLALLSLAKLGCGMSSKMASPTTPAEVVLVFPWLPANSAVVHFFWSESLNQTQCSRNCWSEAATTSPKRHILKISVS